MRKSLLPSHLLSLIMVILVMLSSISHAQTTINLPQACNCPGGSGSSPSSGGTAEVSAYGCNGPAAISGGSLTQGVAVSGTTLVISANVTTAGTYNISTTQNGVTFSGTGTLAAGCQTITLTGSGTPTAAGTFTWTTGTTPSTSATATVSSPTATLTALNCGSATNSGTLTKGTAASGVSSSIAYLGGNGGAYAETGAFSTGVTGLTATIPAGTLANGSGSITVNITGTPATAGTATFNFTIAGQSCTLTRTVENAAATLTALNCGSASNSGVLTVNTPASGVSSSIPYTGGNGGSYATVTSSSTGVSGLTATIAAGTLANGAGNITVGITGTPAAAGTATFNFTVAGQSCAITRQVNINPSGFTAAAPPTSEGTNSIRGKTCFDVVQANDGTGACGLISGRIGNRSDFTVPSTNTQSYVFTPPSTGVSNVRIYYINEVGEAIVGASGSVPGNNLFNPITFTINYNPNNNTLAAGRTSDNPMLSKIYVVYNSNTVNNNNPVDDRLAAITVSVKDCDCCGAKVSATEFREFLCYNLGATMTTDPHVPDITDNGGSLQWGIRGPNFTNDSREDWKTAPNVVGFVKPPTTADPGDNRSLPFVGISTGATNPVSTAWYNNGKTANDPCPPGFRIPTILEWRGVVANNTVSRTGAFESDPTIGFTSAIHFGAGTTKTLTLPNTRDLRPNSGAYYPYGNETVQYWSSTENGSAAGWILRGNSSTLSASDTSPAKTYLRSVRCIIE